MKRVTAIIIALGTFLAAFGLSFAGVGVPSTDTMGPHSVRIGSVASSGHSGSSRRSGGGVVYVGGGGSRYSGSGGSRSYGK